MATQRLPPGKLTGIYCLDGICVHYRARKPARSGGSIALPRVETAALRNVSLDVERGNVMAIVGPSGSGKSTLLQVLAGLTVPDKGTISFSPGNDESAVELHKLPEDARARLRRRHIGFVYQSFQLVETMTALENIAMPLLFAGVAKHEREARAAALLEQFSLADRRTRYPSELSGGEQQRVAIARALISKPSVVLADEPTGNLDTASAKLVINTLQQMHDSYRLTTIFVTHDQRLAKEIADSTIELRDGAIVG
jgi:putative ABC transport system ATP-binding protein